MSYSYNEGDKLLWHEDFEVNDEKVNEQHQRLFVLVNSLINACNRGESHQMLGDALAFLANYTVEHFGYEEHLMEEYGLSGIEYHKQLHEEFKSVAMALIKSYESGEADTEALGEALKNVVASWLVTHIIDQDYVIFEYLD